MLRSIWPIIPLPWLGLASKYVPLTNFAGVMRSLSLNSKSFRFAQARGQLLFRRVSTLYEVASVVIFTTVPSGWCPSVVGDQKTTVALFDRFTHYGEISESDCESQRFTRGT